jgi:hypothetical protein
MAIILGSGTFNQQANTYQIQPPTSNFAVAACRIANYTGDALILTGITNKGADQQYLMPYQQMVYPADNGLSSIPTMSGVLLGSGINPNQVLIEWSTEGPEDFPGTYPTTLAIPPNFYGNGSALETKTLTVSSVGVTVAARPTWLDTTIVNVGPDAITFEGFSASGNAPITIPSGSSVTFSNGAEFTVTDAGAGPTTTVSYFGSTIG